jgi:hypothetical protein
MAHLLADPYSLLLSLWIRATRLPREQYFRRPPQLHDSTEEIEFEASVAAAAGD